MHAVVITEAANGYKVPDEWDDEPLVTPAIVRKWGQPAAQAIYPTQDEAEAEAEGYRRRFPQTTYEVWEINPTS